MPNIPKDIADEITNKRTGDSEDTTKKDETKVEDKQPEKKDDDTTKKVETKSDEPEKKAKGQSIAQVADATDDEDDEDDEDDQDDHDKGDKKDKPKRQGIFKEFMNTKKELKEQRKANQEMVTAMKELVSVVQDLKGDKPSQKDEIETFAEEWGLDKDGTKALVNMLEKKLSKNKSTSDEDEDDEEDDEPKKKVKEDKGKPSVKNDAITLRKIELAIESEYDDFIDSFPQSKEKINIKAVKSFILSDKDNLTKSFNDIIDDMYPGLLAGKTGVDGGTNINGAENDDKVDWNDPKVMSQVDKNPKLKEKYQDDIVARAQKHFR